MKHILQLLIIVLLASPVLALLDGGVGARPLALGGTFLAIADDVNSLYWNPAGLARLRQPNVTSMYAKNYDEVNNYFLAANCPVGDRGVLGIGAIRSSIDGISRLDSSGNYLNSFDSIDQAFYLSYARPLRPNFFWGLNYKLYSQSLADNGNGGQDFDLGILFQPNYSLAIGFDIKNLLAAVVGPDRLERSLGLGLAGRLWDNKLLLAADYHLGQSRSVINGGLEWQLADSLKMRAGLKESGLTAGLGLQLTNYTFDYSFNPHPLGNVNAFSISAEI